MDVLCCDIYVQLPSINGKLFFVGLLFFDVCAVLFSVLNRSVFSIFHRGSQDETVMRSVTV